MRRSFAQPVELVIVIPFGLLLTACGIDDLNAPPDDHERSQRSESDSLPSASPDREGPLPESDIDSGDHLDENTDRQSTGGGIGDDVEFAAHEWGTFTSVVGSDGSYLPGLHHEEESLPGFVHQLDHGGVGRTEINKGIPRPMLPEPVTQKLETPVIYFYSDSERDVEVDVDFPEGYISEWYPQSTARSPDPERLEGATCANCRNPDLSRFGLDQLADGEMTWNVEVSPRPHDLIGVPPDDIWAPSRRVPEADYVSHDDESEKFIFYRGVGQFEPPFRVEADDTGAGSPRFTLQNTSDEAIPAIYLMDIREHRGRIVELSELSAGQQTTFHPAPKEDPASRFAPMRKEAFVETAKRRVRRGLVESGLTDAEARAMVDTWECSYFQRPGWRILYVLPREWTDRMLPIEIDPTPDELVRTLVGRVEVLTPEVERRALDQVERAHRQGRSLVDALERGRFQEPAFRRACELADDPELANWCRREVETIAKRVLFEARDAD